MCIIKAASHSLAFLLSNKKRSWPLDTWEQSLQLQSQALRGRCWSKYAPRLPLQQPKGLMAEVFLRAGEIKTTKTCAARLGKSLNPAHAGELGAPDCTNRPARGRRGVERTQMLF